VELSKNRLHDQEVFVSHVNAALTPNARLKLGKLVVERGFSVSQAAVYYRVSWPTAARWAERYRELDTLVPVPGRQVVDAVPVGGRQSFR
jgi:hypothetical protein